MKSDGAKPARARSLRRGTRRPPGEGERVFEGLGVSPGIAIGPAHVHELGSAPIPERTLRADEVDAERERFHRAVEKSLRQIGKLTSKTAALPPSVAEEIGFLLEAHVQMLSESRLVRGVERRIVEDRMNAEAAVQTEIAVIAQGFEAMEDAYLAARVQDVREVGTRLIRNLTQIAYQAFRDLVEGAVVVAEEVTPADTALMDPERLSGFCAELGGAEGHTAIMARAMGLPAVLGVTSVASVARPGDTIIVDGSAGRVVVRPTNATLEAYERRRVEFVREQKQLSRLAKLPAVTRDGTDVTLEVNIELPREIEQAMAVGAAGVGLLRTEFLFMNRDDVPDEDEQFRTLTGIIEGMQGRPVTVRTLDVGGEKLASSLGPAITPSANPALGLRAIRLGLAHPELLETQLAAILRAAAVGPVRILLPMIATVDEVRAVRAVMARVARKLVRRGVRLPDPLPPLGAMIEIPGAALSADALAQVCDFFAIGTNDLTMYTLAIDRGDDQVAHLYNPLHPAVLRLIQFTAEAALRNRIPVSLCGEIAGDPRFTALLIGLGIRELSMSPIKLPRIKQRVRSIELGAAATRARAIMDQSDQARIAALLDDFNALA